MKSGQGQRQFRGSLLTMSLGGMPYFRVPGWTRLEEVQTTIHIMSKIW